MQVEEKRKQIMNYYGTKIMCEEENGVNFYYRCMKLGLSLLDADEYAILNTLLGYDIGLENAQIINGYLWENNIETIELQANDISKKYIEQAVKESGVTIDFTKWRTQPYTVYEYFEKSNLEKLVCFSESYVDSRVNKGNMLRKELNEVVNKFLKDYPETTSPLYS